ncbi:MAG: hypothetical protein GX644_09555 [Limnobacter sp.]|nr:hypothetical protein [Limnobacter sp.]
MKRTASGRTCSRPDRLAARVAISMLSAAACVTTVAQAQGIGTEDAPSQVARPLPDTDDVTELERQFWDCDYAATTRLMAPLDAMGCSLATERFQRMAFGGDFGALLVWWREHKPVEHGKRDAQWAERAGSGS